MLPPRNPILHPPQSSPQPMTRQQPVGRRPLHQEPAVLVTGAVVVILLVVFFVLLANILN